MTSLEELANSVQQLQRQVIEYRQDILVLEDNLTSTKRELNQELEQTKRELQESKLQQNANLEAQIERFNTLIGNLKNSEGKTLKFACGSTEPGNTQWVQYQSQAICVRIDTSSAGFSEKPFYFTSLGGVTSHWVTKGATSISSSEYKGFSIYLYNTGPITPATANEWGWHIQWLAVGV